MILKKSTFNGDRANKKGVYFSYTPSTWVVAAVCLVLTACLSSCSTDEVQSDPTREFYERTMATRAEARAQVDIQSDEFYTLFATIDEGGGISALTSEERRSAIVRVLKLIEASGRNEVHETTIDAYEAYLRITDPTLIIEVAPLGLARPEFARRMMYARALHAVGRSSDAEQVAISALDAYESRLGKILDANGLSLRSSDNSRNGYSIIRLLERDACAREFHDFCLSIAQQSLFENCGQAEQYYLSLMPSGTRPETFESSEKPYWCFPTSTPYQNSGTQQVYFHYLDVLSDVARRNGFDVPSDIAIGAMPQQALNAEAIASYNIITINSQLTRVAINGMIILDLYEQSGVIRYENGGEIGLYLPKSGMNLGRLLALWLMFLGDDNIEPDGIGQITPVSRALYQAIEIYIVGHELGHLVLGHRHTTASIEGKVNCTSRDDREHQRFPAAALAAEIEADLFAFELLNGLDDEQIVTLFGTQDVAGAQAALSFGRDLYFVTQGTLQALRDIVAGRDPFLANDEPVYDQLISDYVMCIESATCSARLPLAFDRNVQTERSHPIPKDRLSISAAFRGANADSLGGAAGADPRVSAYGVVSVLALKALWENSESVVAYSTLRGVNCP